MSRGDGLAFPGPGGGELGKSTVPQGLARAEVGATAHGFRSSFKDWARHEGVDELLSEFALAHVEGSKTMAAYARDDLLEKRRPVMQGWSDFVCPPGNYGSGDELRRGRPSAARGHEPVFSRRGRADGPGDVVQRRTEGGAAVVVDRDDGDLRVVLPRAKLLVRRDEQGEAGLTCLRQQLVVT